MSKPEILEHSIEATNHKGLDSRVEANQNAAWTHAYTFVTDGIGRILEEASKLEGSNE